MNSVQRRPAAPPRREQGTALLVVLVVLALFLVAGGVAAGLVTQQHRYVQRDVDLTRARYAAESGIHVAIARLEAEPAWRPAAAEVALPGGSLALITVRPYGGFLEVESIAEARGRRAGARATLGAEHPLLEKAVVLGDAGSPLHLAGTTRISGTLLLGPRGLQRGMLRGTPFRGRLDATVEDGGADPLPAFDPAVIEEQLSWLDAALEIPAEDAPLLRGMAGRRGLVRIESGARLTAVDSEAWAEPVTVLVYGALELADGFSPPRGSRVAARGPVVIGEDVGPYAGIVYSRRSLRVAGGRLAGQLFARDSVHVEAGSYLRYPSLVYASGRVVGTERHATIRVAGGATVDGSVVYPGAVQEGQQDRGRVTVEAGALVRGAVLSGGQTHVAGTVHGSVLTHRFYHFASPRSLINWLVDATVLQDERPERFRLPVGLEGEARLEVVRWEELTATSDPNPDSIADER